MRRRGTRYYSTMSISRGQRPISELQHLRLYNEWINETLQNLEQLRDNYALSLLRRHIEDARMVDEFSELLLKYRWKSDKLRQRIRDKTEGITSLRDGVIFFFLACEPQCFRGDFFRYIR